MGMFAAQKQLIYIVFVIQNNLLNFSNQISVGLNLVYLNYFLTSGIFNHLVFVL